MARRRLQKRGEVVNAGGWWKGRFREDVKLADGTTRYQWSPRVNLLPSEGQFKATKKEAERHFWEAYLSKLDANNLTPTSLETVGGFIDRKFDPLHIAHTRRPKWHRYILRLVPEWFRETRLRDVKRGAVQRVCDELSFRYSAQTVRHVKARIHKLFEFASDEECYSGRNPARGVRIGRIEPKETQPLEFGEARKLLAAIECRNTRDLVLFALLSGCRISEILGLKWQYVNLDTEWHSVGRHSLPGLSVAIVNQWYRGDFGPLKTDGSARVIPVPGTLAGILRRRRAEASGGSGFVFAGSSGRPIDAINLAARRLKPAAKAAGLAGVHWHCFRHTLNTWLFQEGLPEPDRKAQLGHKPAGINASYLHVRVDDRRPYLDRIAARLVPGAGPAEPTARDLESLRGYFE